MTLYVPLKLFPEMPELDFTNTSFYETLDGRGLSVVHASRKLEIVMLPAEVAVGGRVLPWGGHPFCGDGGSFPADAARADRIRMRRVDERRYHGQ